MRGWPRAPSRIALGIQEYSYPRPQGRKMYSTSSFCTTVLSTGSLASENSLDCLSYDLEMVVERHDAGTSGLTFAQHVLH